MRLNLISCPLITKKSCCDELREVLVATSVERSWLRSRDALKSAPLSSGSFLGLDARSHAACAGESGELGDPCSCSRTKPGAGAAKKQKPESGGRSGGVATTAPHQTAANLIWSQRNSANSCRTFMFQLRPSCLLPDPRAAPRVSPALLQYAHFCAAPDPAL